MAKVSSSNSTGRTLSPHPQIHKCADRYFVSSGGKEGTAATHDAEHIALYCAKRSMTTWPLTQHSVSLVDKEMKLSGTHEWPKTKRRERAGLCGASSLQMK